MHADFLRCQEALDVTYIFLLTSPLAGPELPHAHPPTRLESTRLRHSMANSTTYIPRSIFANDFPRDVALLILEALPKRDLLQALKVCPSWYAEFSPLLCRNLGPVSIHQLNDKGLKFIRQNVTEVKTLIIRYITPIDVKSAKPLNDKLVSLFDIFQNHPLDVWGFSSNSVLNYAAYKVLQTATLARARADLWSTNMILPPVDLGGTFTSGNPASPCNAVVNFSRRDENMIRKQRYIYIRKGGGLGAAQQILGRPGNMIESLRIFGDQYPMSVEQLHVLCACMGLPAPFSVPKIYFNDLDLENLDGIFDLSDTQSIGFVNNRGPSSRNAYGESNLLDQISLPDSFGGKRLLNEFIHRQTVSRSPGYHNSLAAKDLRAFITGVTGLQTICVHQKQSLEQPPAWFVSGHSTSLTIFSFRSGEEEPTRTQLEELADAAPNLTAIGMNLEPILLKLTGKSEAVTQIEDPRLKELAADLLHFRRLKAVCFFVSGTNFSSRLTKGTLSAIVRALFNEMGKHRLPLQLIHVVIEKPGTATSKEYPVPKVYSFRCEPQHQQPLSTSEHDVLEKLGGGQEYDMQALEELRFGHLYKSKRQLYLEAEVRAVKVAALFRQHASKKPAPENINNNFWELRALAAAGVGQKDKLSIGGMRTLARSGSEAETVGRKRKRATKASRVTAVAAVVADPSV